MAVGRTPLMRLGLLVLRLVVGGTFAYAGWVKANDPAQFIRDLWGFRLLPEDAAFWIAAYAPYLEIVAGLALITGLQRRGAHLLLAGMLGVFIAALVIAWSRGLDVSCGCFGRSSADGLPARVWPIVRDMLLLAALALSIRFDRDRHVVVQT